MSNVRFYRLAVLPNFDVNKYKGIFVHVTETMQKADWTSGSTVVRPSELQMGNGKNLIEWLTDRHIESIASGLWFGGENGWELLTNDTSSGAITAAIQALDVAGYAQATMDTNVVVGDKTDSKLTIKGIKEVDGRIGIPTDNESQDFDIAIDGVYNESTNKIATKSTVTNAIEALDSEGTIQAVTFNTNTPENGGNTNTTLTFKGVKEENGKIAQGDGATTFTVGNANLKIQIGSDTATNVFSANAIEDSTIKLDGLVFKKNGDVISVITPTALASDNRLVTEKDVASLAGAMHYKGTVSSLEDFRNKLGDSDAEEAGDVYIATGIPEGSFTDDKGNVIENGDMIVFNSASEYKVVQSNITLGIKSGQIAKNDGDLSPENNVVIATSNGIKTIGITESDLTSGDKNTRTLTYTNGDADTSDATLFHSTTITDTFKVINKDFNQSINISSTNRSIKIAKKTVDGVDTGVVVDLVWNTSMDLNN